MLNSIYLSANQIDVIQKLVSDFVWRGKNKIRPSVMCGPYTLGGLKMLRVQDIVHTLRVKWMRCLAHDQGLTWSRFIWGPLTDVFPANLFQGLRIVTESSLQGMDPFYASMLRSYAFVNDLYYQKNKNPVLPVNLWGHPKSPHVNKTFATSGYCTVLDLPLLKGKIDFKIIQEALPKGTSSVFMMCYRLQSIFSKYFLQSTPGSNQILDDLV